MFIFAGPSFLPEYQDSLDDHINEAITQNNQENYNQTIDRGIFNMKYSDAINQTGTRSQTNNTFIIY